MSLPAKSQQELYDLFITTLQNSAPGLTDVLDGSINDSLGGVCSVAGIELSRYITLNFNKLFFDLANGPEVTGGPDDLQTLAVDRYGETFSRPGAVQAIDTATFSRANNTAGQITILAGSIVKTQPDANGTAQRYATQADVILTNSSAPSDLTVSVAIKAVVGGAAGSATAGKITVIESSLLDSSIVVTNAGNATGADAENDATYRETIRNLIHALAGATLAAIEAVAKTVSGVVSATPVEQAITAIQYNIANNTTVGQYFYVPKVVLYIADSTGTASPALLSAVRAALAPVRACGVFITVLAATSQTINWTGSMTLNPSGPNYSVLVNDSSSITQAMTNYISALPVGTSFVRATANAAILALFGAAGTNDLTAFTTLVPSGDVAATGTTKFVPGTVALA